MNDRLDKLLKLQSVILVFGTLYAWTNVYISFRRFYSFEGEIFKFRDCFVTNPILTPCFWGAVAFVVALFWSVINLRTKDLKLLKFRQKGLFFLLVFGTIFAWSVFGYEVVSFYRSSTGTIETCMGEISTPLKSSCLYGAIIYLAALLNAKRMRSVMKV